MPSHDYQAPEKMDEAQPASSIGWSWVDVIFVWDMICVIVAAAIGVGALMYAIFTLNGVAFAVALIAIPGAFIGGCLVKGMRDVGRDV